MKHPIYVGYVRTLSNTRREKEEGGSARKKSQNPYLLLTVRAHPCPVTAPKQCNLLVHVVL